jgi:hypothetical protein
MYASLRKWPKQMITEIFSKKCIACNSSIKREAVICPICRSSQSRYLLWANTNSNLAALVLSTISVLISLFAFYNSVRIPDTSPNIYLQLVNFEPKDFSIFIKNIGNAPTILANVELDIVLEQGNGTYHLKAFFNLNKGMVLGAGEERKINLEYSKFLQERTHWEVSMPPPTEEFSIGFLDAASSLGNNLSCSINVTFTRSGYYDYFGNSKTKTNGNCSDVMKWFAKSIGPLKGPR